VERGSYTICLLMSLLTVHGGSAVASPWLLVLLHHFDFMSPACLQPSSSYQTGCPCRAAKALEGALQEIKMEAFPRCPTRAVCGAYISLQVLPTSCVLGPRVLYRNGGMLCLGGRPELMRSLLVLVPATGDGCACAALPSNICAAADPGGCIGWSCCACCSTKSSSCWSSSGACRPSRCVLMAGWLDGWMAGGTGAVYGFAVGVFCRTSLAVPQLPSLLTNAA
jgi:hypothetical protein